MAKNSALNTQETITAAAANEPQLFHEILEAIKDKKGQEIISLDLRDITEAVADFFIICEVNTAIQMATITNHIERHIREKLRERPYHFELSPSWSIVDYINIVVHIFIKEERRFYDLESLWMDARQTVHE